MRPFMEPHIIERGGHYLGFLGPLSMVLIVALLVLGVVLVMRMYVNRPASGSAPRPNPSGPLQILEERFARGEIDEAEFRSRRDALRS